MLKKERSAGADVFCAFLFKLDGMTLTKTHTFFLRDIWNRRPIRLWWRQSQIVTSFRKATFLDCRKYRGISLILLATNVYASIALRRLKPVRESNVLEQHAGFLPGRARIDQIFIVRQLLYTKPTLPPHNHSLSPL